MNDLYYKGKKNNAQVKYREARKQTKKQPPKTLSLFCVCYASSALNPSKCGSEKTWWVWESLVQCSIRELPQSKEDNMPNSYTYDRNLLSVVNDGDSSSTW